MEKEEEKEKQSMRGRNECEMCRILISKALKTQRKRSSFPSKEKRNKALFPSSTDKKKEKIIKRDREGERERVCNPMSLLTTSCKCYPEI